MENDGICRLCGDAMSRQEALMDRRGDAVAVLAPAGWYCACGFSSHTASDLAWAIEGGPARTESAGPPRIVAAQV